MLGKATKRGSRLQEIQRIRQNQRITRAHLPDNRLSTVVDRQARCPWKKKEPAAMVPTSLGNQEPSKLPPVIWANLVFHVPRDKARSKVATKENRRCDRNRAAVSKLHLENEGCRLGKKYGKTKLFHLYLDDMQEGEGKDRRESTPPKASTANLPLSSSESVATPEKCAIKKILVDLRPILDNVMDPLDSCQEEILEEDLQDNGCPSSNTGDSSGEDFLEGEDGTSKMTTTEGGGDQTTEITPVPSKDKGILEDISLPSTPESIRASKSDPRSIKTPNGSQAHLGESKQLQKNNSPTTLILPPEFQSPMFIPRISSQQWGLLETESSTEPPTSPSPDFQIPTQLLLQKLQETTTTDHHRLITEVLSSLREELRVRSPSSGDGEKQNSSSEVPCNKPRKSGTTDNQGKETNADPGATKRRLSKFTWRHHRLIYGAGVGQAAPDL